MTFPLVMSKYFHEVFTEFKVLTSILKRHQSKAPLEYSLNISNQTIYSWIYINEGLACSEFLAGIHGSWYDQNPVILKACVEK